MPNRRQYKAGDYLVRCDISDRICYRSECRLMWDGSLVHWTQFETRHPMDTMKVHAETNNVQDARPDHIDLALNHEDRIP